jgi:GrpB-like predicted nucleotidyltransferase (UPF0157 family)
MARIIEVLPYNPDWPEIYRAEAERLTLVMGPNLIGLHHIGSTSVPGLAAKPTIDILAVVKDLANLDAVASLIQRLGYRPRGENGIVGRRYFNKNLGDVHLFHIHAFQEGHPAIDDHLAFRDYLRTHPAISAEYADLKCKLAEVYRNEPFMYTDGKDSFIQKVIRFAKVWRSSGDR